MVVATRTDQHMPSYIRECSEAYLWGVNNLAKSWGKLLEWLRPAYSQTGCAAIHCQWVPCCWSNSLTSANVHTQVLEWLFERRNSLLHSQQQARERERGLSAAREEWVDTGHILIITHLVCMRQRRDGQCFIAETQKPNSLRVNFSLVVNGLYYS